MFDFLKKLFPKKKKKPKKKVVKAKKKSNKTSSTKAKNAVCYSKTNSVYFLLMESLNKITI